jgi:hypothetical protein
VVVGGRIICKYYQLKEKKLLRKLIAIYVLENKNILFEKVFLDIFQYLNMIIMIIMKKLRLLKITSKKFSWNNFIE